MTKTLSHRIYIPLFILSLVFASCSNKKNKEHVKLIDFEGVHVELPDTLRVGMLNSPTTYFDYRGTPMGYDYELMQSFTKFYGLQFEVMVGANISEMTVWLDEGKIDILASPVPSTSEFKDRVLLCGPKMESYQVLVQKAESDSLVKDVTDLIGREVTVQCDSKYYYRMENLNEEIGGGINIIPLDRDTVSDDDLLAMVYKGEIPITVVDSDVANAALSYYPGLDISVRVSLEQHSQWAVSQKSEGLAKALNRWFSDESADVGEIFKKYYLLSKADFYDSIKGMEDLSQMSFAGNRISPYDEIFKAAGRKYGFDWRLLAAVAYVESHFNAETSSWAGALGLMQVMPRTARTMGYEPNEMMNPSKNVDVAAKALSNLDKMYAKRVPNSEERIDFMLASYNSGPGHIIDAIALAEKYGLDAGLWTGNVEKAAMMKSKPAYYRDPVVKNGYFRGQETVNFVKKVRSAYNIFKSNVEA